MPIKSILKLRLIQGYRIFKKEGYIASIFIIVGISILYVVIFGNKQIFAGIFTISTVWLLRGDKLFLQILIPKHQHYFFLIEYIFLSFPFIIAAILLKDDYLYAPILFII